MDHIAVPEIDPEITDKLGAIARVMGIEAAELDRFPIARYHRERVTR